MAIWEKGVADSPTNMLQYEDPNSSQQQKQTRHWHRHEPKHNLTFSPHFSQNLTFTPHFSQNLTFSPHCSCNSHSISPFHPTSHTILTESHLFTPLLIKSHLFTTPLTESHLFTPLLIKSHLFTPLLIESHLFTPFSQNLTFSPHFSQNLTFSSHFSYNSQRISSFHPTSHRISPFHTSHRISPFHTSHRISPFHTSHRISPFHHTSHRISSFHPTSQTVSPFTTLLTESHLFTTLLTEIGIVAIQQLPLYKLVQRVLQGGVLHSQVQSNECLFSLIPEKWKHKLTLLPRDKLNCEKTKEGHCQSDEHWNHFKDIAGETSERQGGAPMGFSDRIDNILNWTELTLLTFSWLILKTGKYRFDHFLILSCDLENGSKVPRFNIQLNGKWSPQKLLRSLSQRCKVSIPESNVRASLRLSYFLAIVLFLHLQQPHKTPVMVCLKTVGVSRRRISADYDISQQQSQAFTHLWGQSLQIFWSENFPWNLLLKISSLPIFWDRNERGKTLIIMAKEEILPVFCKRTHWILLPKTTDISHSEDSH